MTKNINNVETMTFIANIQTAYKSSQATRSLVLFLAGVNHKDELTIALLETVTEKYQDKCVALGRWPSKKQVSGGNSDKPSGWKALLQYSENILKARPDHVKAAQWRETSTVFQLIASMVNSDKALLKKPADKKTVETASDLLAEESATVPQETVINYRKQAETIIDDLLACNDYSKEDLKNCLLIVKDLLSQIES